MKFIKSFAYKLVLAAFALGVLSHPTSILAQAISCGVPNLSSYLFSSSSTCDVNLNNITSKTVRVAFHIFQKDDGSGNIPNNSQGTSFLNSVLSNANWKMWHLTPMNLSTTSPYFQDSKIRYELVNIYYWKDTNMWSKGNNTDGSHTSALYNFVMQQSINYKHTSIHVFFPGNYSSDGLGGHGSACLGCEKPWSMVEDIFYYFQNGNAIGSGDLLRHELGHNLNLYHSWVSNDLCADTPPNSNCWNANMGCSNNVMDYNNSMGALTLDQVSRCHAWLSTHTNFLSNGTQYGNLSISLSNSGNNGPVTGSTINIGSTSATVNVSAPGVSTFSWTIEGGTGSYSYNVLNDGSTVNLSGLGSIKLEVSLNENCMTFSRSLVFFNGGSYYSIAPNSSNSKVTIKADQSKDFYTISLDGSAIRYKPRINGINIFDSHGNKIHSVQDINEDLYEFDLSSELSGLYYLQVLNKDHLIKFSIQKI